jgi:CxxC-x17-CxxC domain-containing protein
LTSSGGLGDFPQPKRLIDPKEAAAYKPPSYSTQQEYNLLLDSYLKEQEERREQRDERSFKGTCCKCGGTAIVPFIPDDPKKIKCRRCFKNGTNYTKGYSS